MIKLKRFLEDPLGAYETYTKEYMKWNRKILEDNNRLRKEVQNLQKINKRNKRVQSDLSKLKSLDRDWNKVVRTLYWHFTGVKMKKGSEYDFVMKIKKEKEC